MDEIATSRPCSKCGAAIYEDAKYCHACGTRQLADDARERARVAREFAAGTLRSAEQLAREAMKQRGVQKVAGGALLGAGVAMVLPLVPLTAGATLGAAYVGYKMLTKG